MWSEGDWLTNSGCPVRRGGVYHAPKSSGVTAVDIRVSPSAPAVPNSGQTVSEHDPVIAGEHDLEKNEFFRQQAGGMANRSGCTIEESFATRGAMTHVILIVLSVVGVIALVLLVVAVIVALLSGDKEHWPP